MTVVLGQKYGTPKRLAIERLAVGQPLGEDVRVVEVVGWSADRGGSAIVENVSTHKRTKVRLTDLVAFWALVERS